MTNLPSKIMKNAFLLNSEIAWKKADLDQVFEYCLQTSIAIVGIGAWVVREVKDCDENEPILPIHNLDPKRNEFLNVLGRTQEHVIWGFFPFKDGTKGVCSWGASDRNELNWQDYAQETISDAKQIIFETNLEQEIVSKYAPFLHYNLQFELEDGTYF